MTAPDQELPVIFCAFANDRLNEGRYLRNLVAEARAIESALDPAADICEVVIRNNASLGDIVSTFQKYRNRVAIFHYGGHASGLDLLLESASGEVELASAGGLASFLAQQQGLKLVVLNGCATSMQVENLLDAGSPAVVATSESIDDAVASAFAACLYQGLATGASIQVAYDETVAAIKTRRDGRSRDLIIEEASSEEMPLMMSQSRWPWELYIRPGAEAAADWSIGQAANDPLFGLPKLPADIGYPLKPYRSLERFDRSGARAFFGRGHETRELFTKVTSKVTAPVILLFGQSGVGKSSILEAGLLPRLEAICQCKVIQRDSHQSLVESLLDAFDLRSADGLLESWYELERTKGCPFVLVLDHVEQVLISGGRREELDELCRLLREVFHSRQPPQGKLVMSFRKEWYPEIESALRQHELPRTPFFLKRISRRGIEEAVRLSSDTRERFNLQIADNVIERIAIDLTADSESPIAPTLQVLLSTLYDRAIERSQAAPAIDMPLYDGARNGGIQLRDFLARQLEEVAQVRKEWMTSGFLLDLLQFLTTPLGTTRSVALEEIREAYSHRNDITELLAAAQEHALISDGSSSSNDFRLSHDALAPLVRERHSVSQTPGQVAWRVIQSRVSSWTETTAGELLTKSDLRLVSEGRSGMRRPDTISNANRMLRRSLEQVRTASIRWRVYAVITITAFGLLSLFGALQFQKNRVQKLASQQVQRLFRATSQEEMSTAIQSLTTEAKSLLLSSTNENPSSDDAEDRRAAIALAKLGYPNEEFLGNCIVDSRDESTTIYPRRVELPALLDAIMALPEDAKQRLKVRIEKRIAELKANSKSDPHGDRVAMLLASLFRLNWVENELLLSALAGEYGQDVRTQLILILARWRMSNDVFKIAEGANNPNSQQSAVFVAGLTDESAVSADKMLEAFGSDHPGIASALSWLSKRQGEPLILQSPSQHAPISWSVTKQGQRMLVVTGPTKFQTGTPAAGRRSETIHLHEIPHSFEISQTEVTVDQFQEFLDEIGMAEPFNIRTLQKYPEHLSCREWPQIGVTWYWCALYCNWLSKKQGIAEDQLCFPDVASELHLERQIEHASISTSRLGFRLPTEAEWEFACRAGTSSAHYFGQSNLHLPHFAWYLENSAGHPHDVAQLLPNQLGMFDTYGNVTEWCLDLAGTPSKPQRRQRGTFFNSTSVQRLTGSAKRFETPPTGGGVISGFRIARTLPAAPSVPAPTSSE